jgi:two-component sensor histidine kinase
LAALAATHNLLTRQNWGAVSIREVIDDTLRPFRAGDHRFTIHGPPLPINAKLAVTLALALNELATNAAKYGALSQAGGRVEIGWCVEAGEHGGRFRLVWRERGGPDVVPPLRRGFGTRMIERGLASELGGQVRIDFQPAGVVCTVDAPLPGIDE